MFLAVLKPVGEWKRKTFWLIIRMVLHTLRDDSAGQGSRCPASILAPGCPAFLPRGWKGTHTSGVVQLSSTAKVVEEKAHILISSHYSFHSLKITCRDELQAIWLASNYPQITWSQTRCTSYTLWKHLVLRTPSKFPEGAFIWMLLNTHRMKNWKRRLWRHTITGVAGPVAASDVILLLALFRAAPDSLCKLSTFEFPTLFGGQQITKRFQYSRFLRMGGRGPGGKVVGEPCPTNLAPACDRHIYTANRNRFAPLPAHLLLQRSVWLCKLPYIRGSSRRWGLQCDKKS